MFSGPKAGHVKVRLNEAGKVHYHAKDSYADRWRFAGDYMQIPIAQFASWKNAGKRSVSDKVTDPSTGQSFAYRKERFYPMAGKKASATPVPDNDQWWPYGKSSHHTLLEKLNNEQLIDRKREDHVKKATALRLFDVGPHTQAFRGHAPLPSDPAGALERDHVPAAGSLALRNDKVVKGKTNVSRAEAQGMTIAIHSDWHSEHSPTFRGRTKRKDTRINAVTNAKETIKRQTFDSEEPAAAFARDTTYMLDRTKPPAAGQPASPHQMSSTERLTQMGAYRTLFRHNTRANSKPQIGQTGQTMSQGINPKAPAFDIIPETKKSGKKPAKVFFTYKPLPGRTQGQEIAGHFRQRLLAEKFATP